MFQYLISLLLGYIVLYCVVWLHEVGHAIGYVYYGCKKKWYHVTVKPYIFFSTPMPINMEQAQRLSKKQTIIISYGGVIANLLCASICGCVLVFLNIKNTYIQIVLWLFLTLHLAEIVSYMFIGNIYLVSDMEIIATLFPKLRFPNFVIGLILTILYVFIILHIPSEIFFIVITWNIGTVLGMCSGRIIYSMIKKKKK